MRLRVLATYILFLIQSNLGFPANKRIVRSFSVLNAKIPNSTSTPKSSSSYKLSGKGVLDYNDDCFGLVFLTGAFVAKNVIFSSCFLILSAIAASVRNTREDKNSKSVNMKLNKAELYLIPGVVAINAYISSSIIQSIFHENLINISPTFDTKVAWECPTITYVTIVTCVYGFYMFVKSDNK